MSSTVVFTLVAGLLQIGGLVITAVDLGQTWARQPERASLLLRLLGPLIRFMWTRVFRRPWISEGRTVDLAAAGAAISSGSVTVSIGLDSSASLEDQLAQLKREVDAAQVRADQAHSQLAVLKSTVEQQERATATQIEQARVELKEWVQRQSAEGVPLSVVGLSVTALGTLLQLVLDLV